MANDKDESLRLALTNLATASDGRLAFRTTTLSKLKDEFELPSVARSPNPIYVFTVTQASGKAETFVAFTLTLDGGVRPATRAEALGNSLSLTDGKLFNLNPFLLVYDYTEERLLAISAIELFGAFAKHATSNNIPYSGSSTFSLSPNFQNGTISMYAELRSPQVWAGSTGSLTEGDLAGFFERITHATSEQRAEIPSIVKAIRARINASPVAKSTVSAALTAPETAVDPEAFATVDPLDEAVQVDDRIWKMILTAISSSPATILVGPPGTGKSALVRKAIGTLSSRSQEAGELGVKQPLWATPDESWTARDLIGGETIVAGEIVFRPGWVLRSIAEGRWLVLDEANRGDLDRIFGALLTWLSGGTVSVGMESSAESAKRIELGWVVGPSRVENVEGSEGNAGVLRYLAGDDWRLIGTYNALDSQRVFRIGAALGRRFIRVPVPPLAPSLFARALEVREPDLPHFAKEKINHLYRAHYGDENTRLGPALFLGMCGYIKIALAARLLEAVSSPGGQTNPTSGEELTAAQSETEGAADLPLAMESTTRPAILSEALCEAYVLNVGTQLAQLEEPDFEQLHSRLRGDTGLTEDELEWVKEMMNSLA